MHLYFALASPKFREQKDNLAMKPQTSIFFFSSNLRISWFEFQKVDFFRVFQNLFFRKFQFVLVYTFMVFWSNKKRPHVARNITSHVRVLQHFLFNRCRLVRRCLACWDRPLNVCDLTPRFPRRRKCLLLYWSLYGWCGLITRMTFFLWQMGRNTSILFRGNRFILFKEQLVTILLGLKTHTSKRVVLHENLVK